MYIVAPQDSLSQSLLPLYLITAGTQHDQEERVRPNGAAFHQLFFIEEGEGYFEWNGQQRLLPAGTALFIPKGYPVLYRRHGSKLITAWVAFDGVQAENMLNYFHAEPMERMSSAALFPLIAACCQAAHRGASPARLSAQLYQILIAFFEAARQKETGPALEKAKIFARAHLAQDLSVADLAKEAGISASLLYRLFQQEGHTPVSFLRRERIRHAKELLLQRPEQKISQIAAACGFGDCAYFCKVFREETGVSPLQYRKNFK